MDSFSDFSKAEEYAKLGRKKDARAILRQILSINNRDEKAWILFADVAEKKEDEINCLNNVLRINPNNDDAKQRLFFLTNQVEKSQSSSNLTFDSRICPFCKEKVNNNATACSHCGRDISTIDQKLRRFISAYIRNLIIVGIGILLLYFLFPQIMGMMFQVYWYILGPVGLLALAVFALPKR
jgi:tetratricopeptide (TPR) repeat protein